METKKTKGKEKKQEGKIEQRRELNERTGKPLGKGDEGDEKAKGKRKESEGAEKGGE